MQAITTKYLRPTNTKGSRIVASYGDGYRTTISYPHNLDAAAAHRRAAEALLHKMNWQTGTCLISGRQRRDTWVHVVMVHAE